MINIFDNKNIIIYLQLSILNLYQNEVKRAKEIRTEAIKS